MERLTKKRLPLLIVTLILAVTSCSSLEIYGAVTVTGNSLAITPQLNTQSTPNIVLTANSTTPHVGDTVALTATMSSHTAGVMVFYYYNSTFGNAQLGTATTSSNGVAVYNLPIMTMDTLVIYPQASVP